MSEDMEVVLRKSLDEIERTRRRQWMLLILSLCAMILFLFGVARTATHAGEPQLFGEIMPLALISILTSIMVVLALSAFNASMTRKILKAIELQSKK